MKGSNRQLILSFAVTFFDQNWQAFYYKTEHQESEKGFSRFEGGDKFYAVGNPCFPGFPMGKVVINTGVREVSQYNKLFFQLGSPNLFFYKYLENSLSDTVHTHCKQTAGS